MVGDHDAKADDVSVRLPPLHIVEEDGVNIGTAGVGLNVTSVVAVVVHTPIAGLVALSV